MRRYILNLVVVLFFCGPILLCPAEERNVQIEASLATLKGVDVSKLSEAERKRKFEEIQEAWNTLIKAGKPAGERIRQELKKAQADSFFIVEASAILFQIEKEKALADISRALSRADVGVDFDNFFLLCHFAARTQNSDALPILDILLRNSDLWAHIPAHRFTLGCHEMLVFTFGVYGPGCAPWLMEKLSDPEPAARYGSAYMLGFFAYEPAAEKLRGLLSDADPTVQRAALFALGRIGDENDIPAIAKFLKNPSPRTRQWAVSALADMESPKALPFIISTISDEDILIRRGTFERLKRYGTRGCMAAIAYQVAHEPDETLRAEMTEWLVENGTADALEEIEKARLIARGEAKKKLARIIEAIRLNPARKKAPRYRFPPADFRLKVSRSRLKEVLEKLVENSGKDFSAKSGLIYASASSIDLPLLEKVRQKILWRLSEGAAEDAAHCTDLMRRIRLREKRTF